MQPSPGGWVGSLFSSVIYIFCFQETHQVRGIVFTLTRSSECDAFLLSPLVPWDLLSPASQNPCPSTPFPSISDSGQISDPCHWARGLPFSASSPSCSLTPLSGIDGVFSVFLWVTDPQPLTWLQVPWNLVSQGRVHGGALYSSWSMGPLPLPVPTSTLQNAFGFNPPFTDQFVVFWPKEILSCFQEYSIFKKYLSLYLDLKLSCGKHEVTRPK